MVLGSNMSGSDVSGSNIPGSNVHGSNVPGSKNNQPKKATAIIPARLESTRFPRKALAADTGTPLIVHVCERAAKARRAERVVVATDAEEIAETVRAHGFEAVMTGEHDNGTSRVHEAAHALRLARDASVINVQGDEPEIDPETIDAAFRAHRDELDQRIAFSVGTVASPFAADEDPGDPNIVKAVVARDPEQPDIEIANAIYFSRAPVPFDRDGTGPAKPLKHVGIYAYSPEMLSKFVRAPAGELERTEKLEQLRWYEMRGRLHGVRVAIRPTAHHGIDTPEQYAAFVERWRAT